MQTKPKPIEEFFRQKHILKIFPIAPSTLWNWVNDGFFPAPIKLSEGITVWKKQDIQNFIDDKELGHEN
jgi:prophage regulatory protein